MIIKFIVEIEVEDFVSKEESKVQAKKFEDILTTLDHAVEDAGFETTDRDWVAITN